MRVIEVKGNVRYGIRIDGSVWILDEGKFGFEKNEGVDGEGCGER
ncbi:hypothetical protein [Bacillus velezensis]|nr:hypothetical protein [Bacillus velezensis]